MTRLIEEEEAFRVLSAYYKHSTPVQDSALHDALSRVPSADLVNEWCTDCKEYDKAQHCCHRFTKVIRQTMEELKQNAVPVKRGEWINTHEMDEWYCTVYECSVCGFETLGNDDKFCGGCGADMRGEG